ncbi:ribonuclease E/G [Roseomonas gilardii]|uniref:ribonuclease E/G n=1 Tax=Roseomonas gilardii TaxID=257708 RepID=UPI0004BAD884|nr:ribonuclease E/G [Roseomonas gilardii]SUE43464.1 Ribonuclease E [Roseomonas gilardii subsp. rosea]
MPEMLILHSASPGERRTALLRDGVLEEAWIERPARPDGVGDILVGRVTARVPALSGVFLALPGEKSGFLPDAQGGVQGGEGVSEGTHIAVRVVRGAQGGKGPRLDRKIPRGLDLPSPLRGPPRLLQPGPAAVERLAQTFPKAVLRTDSAETVRALRPLGVERLSLATEPVFGEDLEEAFDALARPEVPLPGGGRLLIHPTPALVAIDVDTGAATGRDRAAQARVNEAALAEAARQIRLRRLAGPILIDFAGMAPKARGAFLPALREAARPDTQLRIMGLTALGLIECVRTRVHPPLHEITGQPPTPLTLGLAALRRVLRALRHQPGLRPALRAHPRVLAALREWPGALEEFEAMAALPLVLRPDAAIAFGEELAEDA